MSTAAATDETTTLSGVVTDLKMQKPTFCAGYLLSAGRRVSFSVKGFVEVNKPVTLRGVYETHPKWGRQFKGSEIVYTLPADADGIAAWLAATVDGVGKVKADAMAAAFGPSLPRLLREDPEQVAVECNLPIEFVKRIAEKWWAAQDECNCCAKLGGYGLTQHEVSALYARYKGSAVSILESDPYLVLGDLPGFGWARVDGIGGKLGVPAADPGRVRAAVQTAVKKLTADGSTVVDRAAAVAEAADMVGATVTAARIEDGLAAAVGTKAVHAVGAVGLTTPAAWRDERDLWAILAAARKVNPCFPDLDPDAAAEAVRGYELPTADGRLVKLDESQVAAVVLALTNRLTVITGGAGSGKTLVAKAVLRFLAEHRFANARADDADSDTWDAPVGSAAGDPRRTVALAAPTGKAARRLAEVTGRDASTIHRLLGWSLVGQGQWDFEYKAANPLPYSCVIVDECFPWKQIILTETGQRHIGKIVENKEPVRVWSRNPRTGRLELKRVVRWLKRPAPETLLRIDASRANSLRGARVIRCTHSHKILTPAGYVRAEALKAGDRVAVRGTSLNPVQRSVLVGSIFGDGSIARCRSRSSPQVRFTQGEDQADYLDFKRLVFGGLAAREKVYASGYANGRPVHSFALAVTDDQYEIVRHMQPDGTHPSGKPRWRPSAELLERIDQQALCVWYLDNGSTSFIGHTPYAKLHTERFSVDTNRQIAEFLATRYGLTAVVQETKNGYSLLRFNKDSTAALFDLIRPYVPECMAWKVPGGLYHPPTDGAVDTCEAVIREIKEEPFPRDSYSSVYDIEVEDHHNFVAGNIVVSNCSMMDASLSADLLSACDPHTMVVLLGDPNQLPPVGAGYPLRDVLEHGLAPAARLEKCHRQAGPLKANCVRVLAGVVEPTAAGERPGPWLVHRQLDTPEAVKAAVQKLFDELFPAWGYADLTRHQFMTAKHDGPLGTKALNEFLQKLAQARLGVRVPDRGEHDRVPLLAGDKVIQTRNNYQLGVMNGTVGVVAEDGPALVVDYDGRRVAYPGEHKGDVQLGYCLTPHKMQGSEVPCAVLIVPKAHAFMQHRSWVYTGLTRAQRTAIVLGDYEGIRRAADKVEVDRRQTLLRLFATNPGVRP